MIVSGPEHREYLETKLNYTLQPDAVFIANEKPYGVAGFERFNGFDMEVHYSGEKGFITRPFLRCLAWYAFKDMGCDRLTGRIPAWRPDAVKLGLRLGFKHEGTLRRACNGEDILIFGMLKEECRWL